MTSPNDLADVISMLKKAEIDLSNKKNPGQQSQFTTVPITIEIRSRDTVDQALVDLPGLFQMERLDRGGSGAKASLEETDVERVKTTLLDYLEDELTILLVVVPANANLKNANIFRLTEEFKDDLDLDQIEDLKARTIYCFTKVT